MADLSEYWAATLRAAVRDGLEAASQAKAMGEEAKRTAHMAGMMLRRAATRVALQGIIEVQSRMHIERRIISVRVIHDDTLTREPAARERIEEALSETLRTAFSNSPWRISYWWTAPEDLGEDRTVSRDDMRKLIGSIREALEDVRGSFPEDVLTKTDDMAYRLKEDNHG